MATNRPAVTTTVQKQLAVNIININRAVALTVDTTVTELKRLYTSFEDIESDFLTTTDIYKMAKNFFDDGGVQFYVVPVTGESAGNLITTPQDALNFVSINDGTFNITVDGVVQGVTVLDFTSDTTLLEVVATINAVLTGATLTLDSQDRFVFTSDTTGVTSSIASIGIEGTGTDISTFLVEQSVTVGDKDITSKLTELENDGDVTFSFIAVLVDRTLSASNQITDKTLIQFAFNKEYHVFVDTTDVNILLGVTTDIASVNKSFYDNLSGDNKLKLGNFSMIYVDDSDDFIMSGIVGKLMSKDIGSQTVKFMKPINSEAITLTNSELTNILNKNTNVFTGTNERTGRSFVKEGTTLKDGDYIDSSLGAIWIKVQLENAVYDLLETRKVPINLDGFTDLENFTQAVFTQAVSQGIIDTEDNVKASTGKQNYTIEFTAGNLAIREIIGTYTYFEALAGHFVTNTVTIQTPQ